MERFTPEGYDNIGPGTKAWIACERAVWHKLHGRETDAQHVINEMTRKMLDYGCDARDIRHNEEYIARRVAEQNPDDYDMEFDEEPTV